MTARRPVLAPRTPASPAHRVCLAMFLIASLPACIRDADPGDAAQDAALAGGTGGAGGLRHEGGEAAGGVSVPDRDIGTPPGELDMSVVEPCPADRGRCTAEERDRLCYVSECERDPYEVYYRCDGTAWNYDSQSGYDCGGWPDAGLSPPDLGTGAEPDATPRPACPYEDARAALGPCTAELEGVECRQEVTCRDGRVEPESVWCRDGMWTATNNCFDE